MGGEKSLASMLWAVWLGSPPHGRGKVLGVQVRSCRARITPAWAGKRARCPCWCAGGQDHPRTGGEKTERSRRLQLLQGSPPQGGEKVDPTGNDWYTQGSPPRGRGNGRRVVDHHPLPGITPAWAGKRRPTLRASPRAWDHPRVGGEKSGHAGRKGKLKGSPPRGRGKGCAAAAVAL